MLFCADEAPTNNDWDSDTGHDLADATASGVHFLFMKLASN